MEYITLWAKRLAQASNHSVTIIILVMFAAFMAFNFIESMIERLLFGKPFFHGLDPIFAVLFILFTLLSIYYCHRK